MNKEQEQIRKSTNKMLGNPPNIFFVGEKVRCLRSNWWCEEGHITTVADPRSTVAHSAFWVKDNLGKGYTDVCQTETDWVPVEETLGRG